MTQSSFPLLFSSTSSCHRLVTLITILLLNPLPIIYGAPTKKTDNDLTAIQRHKRQVLSNEDDGINFIDANEYLSPPESEIVFEGLLGCKYDVNVCNQNEACFDDGLFGQCWNGEGSARSAFALKSGVDGLTDDKLIAIENTLEFLNRYHLNWRDYLTQCILSHIFSDTQQINQNRLEIFYNDCLNKDEILDELAAVQEDNIYRRELRSFGQNKNFYYKDPYMPLTKSNSLIVGLEKSYNIPLLMEYDRPNEIDISPMAIALAKAAAEEAEEEEEEIQQQNRFNTYYIDSDELVLEDGPTNLIAEESIMNEPAKVSVHTNEGHPGLLETLQINNNKQLLPVLTEDTMPRQKLPNNNKITNNSDAERYFAVETARGYIVINRDFKDQIEGARLLSLLAQINTWPAAIFTELNADHRTLTFHVLDNAYQINASNVANAALNNQKNIETQLGIHVIDSGIGNPRRGSQLSVEQQKNSRLTIITLVTCALVLFTMAAFALLYFIKRNDRIRNKLAEITHIRGLSTNYYQDLCRQRMQVQPTGNKSPEIHRVHQTSPSGAGPTTVSAGSHVKHNSEGSSTRSSTSSWSEEPLAPVNMDIMTGHLILSYMEDHLRDRHRLEAEWQALCTDEANEERASCSSAVSEANANKNRYIDCIPYDHARIRLANGTDGDYINASTITDSDPKCKYIATQGPMPNTTNAFWQMVWEQGSCVIVALTRPIENGITMCHHYWPVEGSARFNDFEVNLVSEHIWSDDYLVRSFYLKNVQTMETRTVTQFHFLTWGELNNPPSAKSLLDFRRKVNKCFRGRSSPIIVHCNDGVGRTGTFILLDIVLNRICKGAREINIAATLEHIRDQRAKMVKTKDQFEFVFVAVAEEVTYLLKAIPQ
jgi:protein tyrosine phosphatase